MKRYVRKFVAPTVIAGVALGGALAASPAYANINHTGCPGAFQISGPGKATQCFSWDGTGNGNGQSLLVNDWYTQVHEYAEVSCVEWRDITNGDDLVETTWAGTNSDRPGPNFYLVRVNYEC